MSLPDASWLESFLPVELTGLLERYADRLESEQDWPGLQFQALQEAGLLGWVIPPRWGGTPFLQPELIASYVRLAQSCLTTAFVLTQRNAACQRLADSSNDALKDRWLPGLARGEFFATVGISHLSTSRQHLRQPAVTVDCQHGGYLLNGEVPWVTGAQRAQLVVTGGVTADGQQLLLAVPTSAPGVRCGPSARLLALGASQTSSMTLHDVAVDAGCLVAGPAPAVMKTGTTGGAGSLGTSALALGLARSTLAHLAREALCRPELGPIHAPLEAEAALLFTDLMRAAGGGPAQGGAAEPSLSFEALRSRANSLVLRSAQALLSASKGAGFIAGHFAHRAVREAHFFLVWSCPQPVVAAYLRELAGCQP
jgi:alkylation response protein AidB-like acyl-CoA dehydrogenase